MSVVIRPLEGSKDNELFVIELQGTIIAKDADGFDGKRLGKLRRCANGKYEMIIGNHVLAGTPQTLKKPLVILDASEEVEAFHGVDELRSSVCHLRGVVREKLIFKSRPNIVVGASEDDAGLEVERENSERLRS